MSTRKFLESLEYEQLLFARDCADELIKRKNEEQKIPLWVVCDQAINYAAYTLDQYDTAVQRLCLEIQKYAKCSIELNFSLEKHFYRESEVPGMLALGDKP